MRHLALAIPFLLGGLGTRAAVPLLGDSLARALVAIVPSASASTEGGAEASPRVAALPDEDHGAGDDHAREPRATSRRVASRGPVARRHDDDEGVVTASAVEAPPAKDEAPRGTIVIPASAVARALEKRDVGATNAKNAAGEAVGARLHGVGKYGVGLRDGDIVVSVQGTRTPTVAAMTSAAMGAASGGATRLTGKVLRGSSTFSVVLDVPR